MANDLFIAISLCIILEPSVSFGRKKFYLSIQGTVLSYILFRCHQNLPLMFIARALDGASGVIFPVAQVIGVLSVPKSFQKFWSDWNGIRTWFILGSFWWYYHSWWLVYGCFIWFALLLSNVILVIR